MPASAVKILVIENERERLIYITNLLHAHGYDPVTARRSEEGLDKARTERPALIVLDALLPVDETQLVYTRLKSDPLLSRVPVVVLSTLKRRAVAHYFLHPLPPVTGRLPEPEAFLPNPPEAEEFIAVVRRLTTAFPVPDKMERG